MVAVHEQFNSYQGVESSDPVRVRKFTVAARGDQALDFAVSGQGFGSPDHIPAFGEILLGDGSFVVDDRAVIGRGADQLSIVQVTYRRGSWSGKNIRARETDVGGAFVRVSTSTIAEPFAVPRVIKHEVDAGAFNWKEEDGVTPLTGIVVVGYSNFTTVVPRQSTIYTATVNVPSVSVEDLQTIQYETGRIHEDFNLSDVTLTTDADGWTFLGGDIQRALFMGGEIFEADDKHKEIRYQWKIQSAFLGLRSHELVDSTSSTTDTVLKVSAVLTGATSGPKDLSWWLPHENIGLMDRSIPADGAATIPEPVYYRTPQLKDFQIGNLQSLPGLSGWSP